MIIAGFKVTPKAVIDLMEIEFFTQQTISWKTVKNILKNVQNAKPRSNTLAEVTFFVHAFNTDGIFDDQRGCQYFKICFYNVNTKAVLLKLINPLQQQLGIQDFRLTQLELAIDFYKNDGLAWTPDEGAEAVLHLIEYFKHPEDVANKRLLTGDKPVPIDLSRQRLKKLIIQDNANFAFNRKYVDKNGRYDIRADNVYYHTYFKCKDKHNKGEFIDLPIEDHRPRLEVNMLYSCDISALSEAIKEAGKCLKLVTSNPKHQSNKYSECAAQSYLLQRGQDTQGHWHNGNFRRMSPSIKLDAIGNRAIYNAVKNRIASFK